MKKNKLDIKKIIKKRIEYRQSKLVPIKKRNVQMNNRDRLRNNYDENVQLIDVELTNRNEIRTGVKEVLIKNKKVNVIISAFDCAEYIEECLDSISLQTYKCKKILLGIDGCKKTLQKIQEIRQKYVNLEVYYSEENNGPYQMFNALMMLVPDDEYIQRFDADDVMNPNMLENMVKNDTPAISRHHGMLFFNKKIINGVGGFRDWKCAADSDIIMRLNFLPNIKVKILPKYFFRREHEKQLTVREETNRSSVLRKNYETIIENNGKSENPIIYITPTCSVIKIIL